MIFMQKMLSLHFFFWNNKAINLLIYFAIFFLSISITLTDSFIEVDLNWLLEHVNAQLRGHPISFIGLNLDLKYQIVFLM